MKQEDTDTKDSIRILADIAQDFRDRKRKLDELKIEEESTSTQSEPPKSKLKKEKKEKKNDHKLALSSVTSRLQAIGEDVLPVTLDSSIRDVAVPRDFMKDHYGGNTQSTYPKIGKAFLAKHGLDDFMYPKLDNNPHAPQSPGAPGLLYRTLPAPAFVWPKEQRLFIGLAANQWLYVGQYKLTPSDSLSKEEWLRQDVEFRKKWINIVGTKGRGLTMRAKISLRKELGREPTQDELDTAIASEPKPAKGHLKFELDAEEIEEAYDTGVEQIPIWCMKCVRYDEQFQRDLAHKFSAWKSRSASNTKPKSKSKKKPRRTTKSDSEDDDSDD